MPDLYYNRYRDYDPTTGRHIQADPIGLAGGASPYSYAMNNPLRHKDPTGEFVPLVGAIIGGAVLGGIDGGFSDFAGQVLGGRSLNCIDWGSVGRSAGSGALWGAALGGGGRLIYRVHRLSGPTGPLLGRAVYRNERRTLFNSNDKLRIGWSWNANGKFGARNYFGIHGGKAGNRGHWHVTPIPGPRSGGGSKW